jgi:diphosphomevalonate decarboxylase
VSRRATVSAPANIAFVKYWGARDVDRALPLQPSISMTLEVCRSLTTAEARDDLVRDEVWLAAEDGRLEPAGEAFAARVRRHLDAIRARTGRRERFRVATRNSFPAAAGLASSASGFAALACAVSLCHPERMRRIWAGEVDESPLHARVPNLSRPHPDPSHPLRMTGRVSGAEADARELSILARLSGSGSAARSVLGGYVEWPAEPGDEAPAHQLAPAGHWDLRCVIALLETGAKEVSSLEGHRRAPSSPHFTRRLELVPERLAAVRRAIRDRDLAALGPVLEREAIELHAIAMTSEPPIFYWRPATLEVLAAVRNLRGSASEGGVQAWATMDAGANVHVLCPPEDEPRVAAVLEAVPGVRGLIRDRVGDGPRQESVDLLAGGDAG